MEFIASSTQLEATQDWFTERIVELMGERKIGFVEAARLVAHDNLTGHGEHATRSARPDPLDLFEDAPVRRAVVLAVAHYHGDDPDPELPRVAEQLAPDGIASKALEADYGPPGVEILRDPSAAEMSAVLERAISDLGAAAARAGKHGELLVFFDGHGNSHGIAGSDGEEITFDDLAKLNEKAVAANVHLVVVSNGCFQGAGVLLAERLTNLALAERLQAAKLPPERTGQLLAALTAAADLIDVGQALSQPLEEVGRIAGGDDHAWSETETVSALRATLERVASRAEASVDVSERLTSVRARLAADSTDGKQVAALAADLDYVSDSLTEEIAALQELVTAQLDAAGAQPRSTQGST